MATTKRMQFPSRQFEAPTTMTVQFRQPHDGSKAGLPCARLSPSPAGQQQEIAMAKKGYWVSAYRSIKDPDKVAAYAKLAGPALNKFGARYLARDVASNAY